MSERSRFEWFFAPETTLQANVGMALVYLAFALVMALIIVGLMFAPIITLVVAFFLGLMAYQWFARTGRETARLNREIETRRVSRSYWANSTD